MTQHLAQQQPLKITRRGRLVLSALIALPVLTASVFLASPGAQAGDESGELQYYTVLSGESLWNIAEQLAPERDPREVIDQLRQTNGLSGVEVQPGKQLIIPAGL